MCKIIIIFVLMFFKISVSKLIGKCNQCSAGNKVACLDEQHFSTCFRGSATSTITKCPDNNFCTDDQLICRPSAGGFEPICYNDYCGECEITNGIFSCLDDTTYGYCFGNKIPDESTFRQCPSGYVCNHNYREICVPEDTIGPSCTNKSTAAESSPIPTESTTADITLTTNTESSLTEQTNVTAQLTTGTQVPTTATILTTTRETTTAAQSTTKAAPRDPNTICRGMGRTGYFLSDDPTCRQYVFCYLLSGQYLGVFYFCEFYFNAATQKCQSERPLNCVAS